jgi:hypothetical protein
MTFLMCASNCVTIGILCYLVGFNGVVGGLIAMCITLNMNWISKRDK